MDYTIATNTVAVGAGDGPPATGTPGEFTEGNPATSIPATVVPGYQMNALVQEIINVIKGGGLTPDRTNTGQLLAGIHGITVGNGATLLPQPPRNTGVVYTNSTTRPLFVLLYVGSGNGNGTQGSGFILSVAGVQVSGVFGPSTSGVSISGTLVAFVPPGATYEVNRAGNQSGNITTWVEF